MNKTLVEHVHRSVGILTVTVAFTVLGPGASIALAVDCTTSGPNADHYCPPTPATAGNLPFEGFDFGPVGLVAIVLLASGVALAKLCRRTGAEG